MAKGADTLIEALAVSNRMGRPFRVKFVGAGRHRDELIQLARRSGVAEQIQFIGTRTRTEIKDLLDAADLFIIPSRTEGMPRALLEAMARALPCVTTDVGGILEVIASEDTVPANDPTALASKVYEVVSTKGRLAEMSRRNLDTARRFSFDLLQRLHLDLQAKLQDCTRVWQSRGRAIRQGRT
jgi:glycosyltransferase involved in cell wall biosynthesis